MADILIIDDDPGIHYTLTRAFTKAEHRVDVADTAAEGRTMASQNAYDVIFLDVNLPDQDGVSLLPTLKNTPGSPEIVIITGFGSGEGAELAITHGAWDYVEKSQSLDEIRLTLARALKYHGARNAESNNLETTFSRDRIIGESAAITACLSETRRHAQTDSNVLIQGETGVGKEVFARTLHENSARKSGPFVVVDCASLPDTLAESILFGHNRGAFTGAETRHQGLVAEAHGGTLFLDEVGELPLNLQKILLRVLQEHTIRPVGSTEEINVDFRLVSATNRDLAEMANKETFRSDLLYRIQTCTLHLPPLRDRGDDVRALTRSFVTRYCQFFQATPKEISNDFFKSVATHHWPGNIRELAAAMEYAVSAARFDAELYPQHLPVHVRAAVAKKHVGSVTPTNAPELTPEPKEFPPLAQYRDDAASQAEAVYLKALLSACAGDTQQAIKTSGLSRSRFYALLKKHAL